LSRLVKIQKRIDFFFQKTDAGTYVLREDAEVFADELGLMATSDLDKNDVFDFLQTSQQYHVPVKEQDYMQE
jgi:hypothetical protein